MTRSARRLAYTEDDYFAIERMSEHRHEFAGGEILAMAGGKPRHNYLAGRAVTLLGGTRGLCFSLAGDQRIGLPDGSYTYADGSAFCGPIERGREETALNPVALVEVLSDSTRDYDRGDKLDRYKNIASLRHVLLMEQDVVRVEHWCWIAGVWLLRIHEVADVVVDLAPLGVSFKLADLYAGIERVV